MHKFLTPVLSVILFLGISPLCTGCYTHTAKHQNSLKIAISHDPMSLDPRSACLSKDISIAQALYEGLVRERSAHPELALAQYYTISSDQTVYTFYLKEAS